MSFSDLMKKWHKRYVEDEEEKTHFSHSLSYHNYFQGYSERKVLNPGGNGYRIQREYTAHYLAFTEDKHSWIRYKILYAALYFISAALSVLALFTRAQANRPGWVAVFGVFQALMLLMMLIPMVNYLCFPMYMRLGQYNISAKRVGQFAIPAAAFSILYFLTGLAFYIIKQATPVGNDIRWMVIQFFSAAAILVLSVLESKMKYKRIENTVNKETGYNENEIW